MTPGDFFKWFWVAALVITGLNAAYYRYEANKDIRNHPERAEGYRRLIRGILLWSGLPWILLGVFTLTGAVDSIMDLFQTKLPAALVWQVVVLLINLRMLYWIFVQGGAETLARHPAML